MRMLDAQTAYEVGAFLHWLAITLQRVHDVDRDPYLGLDDAIDSAERSMCTPLTWFTVLS